MKEGREREKCGELDLLLQFSLGGIWRLVYFIRKRHKSEPSDTLCRIDSNTTHLPSSSSLSLSLSLLRLPFRCEASDVRDVQKSNNDSRQSFLCSKGNRGEECCASSTSFSSPFFSPYSSADSRQRKLQAAFSLSLSFFFPPPSLARALVDVTFFNRDDFT